MNDAFKGRGSGRSPLGARGLFLLALAGAVCAHAAPSAAEYDVKAVFLYQFTQFVEWPQAAFPDPDAPFVIGLVGGNRFGAALETVVGGEAVGRHHLAVKQVDSVTAEFRCQILYFFEDAEDLLDLRRLRSAPVLTVGESESFYKKGGMIQFFIDRRRVRLKVNLEEARAHSLEVSAKLLRVADVTDWDPIRIGVYTWDDRAGAEGPPGLLAGVEAPPLPSVPLAARSFP